MNTVRVPKGCKRVVQVLVGYRSANNRYVVRIIPTDIIVKDGSIMDLEIALSVGFSA